MKPKAKLFIAQIAFVSMAFVASTPGRADPAPAAAAGKAVYQQHCAACHDQTSARIPSRSALEKLSATRILRTLDFGLMMIVAYPLRQDERDGIRAGLAGAPR